MWEPKTAAEDPEVGDEEDGGEADALVAGALGRDGDPEGAGADLEGLGVRDRVLREETEQPVHEPERGAREGKPPLGRHLARSPRDHAHRGGRCERDRDAAAERGDGSPRQRGCDRRREQDAAGDDPERGGEARREPASVLENSRREPKEEDGECCKVCDQKSSRAGRWHESRGVHTPPRPLRAEQGRAGDDRRGEWKNEPGPAKQRRPLGVRALEQRERVESFASDSSSSASYMLTGLAKLSLIRNTTDRAPSRSASRRAVLSSRTAVAP